MHELGALQLVLSLCPGRWKSEVTWALTGDKTKISTKSSTKGHPENGFSNNGIK